MDNAFGIYLHWPFCLSKCPYCDFNSHVVASIDQTAWRRALLTELSHFAERTQGREVGSVFFGGGTPSLMEPATAAALIDAISGHWTLAPDVEITLEANPGTIDSDRFRDFRAAGIGRLSMGVQSLDDAVLAFLGRRHTVAEAVRAIELARAMFPRFSFDLIYARPGQTLAAWREELAMGLALASEHLSLYQLTVEPGTAFQPAYARGDFTLPADDLSADLYDLTQDLCGQAGLFAYEVSNHARPGAECRGNLLYWQGGDYVGVGPGAHGRLTLAGAEGETARTHALRQHRAPLTWIDAVAKDGHATAEDTPLSPRERIEELVMMGLRLVEGIPAERFLRQTGIELSAALSRSALETMTREGLLLWDGRTLAATRRGRLVLNGVTAALLD